MAQMLQVTLTYYGFLRDRYGGRTEALEVPVGTSLEDLLRLWLTLHPGEERILRFVRVAVGDDYVPSEHRLAPGDDVSFIPPVSGGAGPPEVGAVRLSSEPLEWGGAERLVERSGAGAVVTFRGIIRDRAEGREVEGLYYEARESMALAMMRRLREEALAREDITGVAIWHRVGELSIGELAVEIAVSSPHRAAAFEVARQIIEAFKTDIPIFKREHFADGGEAWKNACD